MILLYLKYVTYVIRKYVRFGNNVLEYDECLYMNNDRNPSSFYLSLEDCGEIYLYHICNAPTSFQKSM